MRLSLNEIETTARKAALARGWSLGLADEFGRAVLWLWVRGCDGPSAGLSALQAPARAAEAHQSPNGWTFANARVLAAVPAAVDLLIAEGKVCRLLAPDQPLIALGLAGTLSEHFEQPIRMIVNRESAAVICPGRQIAAPILQALTGPVTAIEFTRASEHEQHLKDRASASEPKGQGHTTPETWAALTSLAKRTMVQGDTRTRATGAGAGLIDRD